MSGQPRKKNRKRGKLEKPIRKVDGRSLWPFRWVSDRPWMIVLVMALIAHVGALTATFYFDDMRLLLPFTEGDFSYYGWSLRWSISSFRVLTMWTFWATYQVTGLSSVGFHAVNLAMHAGVAVLSYFIARDWLSRDTDTAKPIRNSAIALAAACMFAAHPLGSEITHYVRARDTLLMTGFGLASVGAFSSYRRRGVAALIYGTLLSVAAMYSKPTGPAWIACLIPWTLICFWYPSDWKSLAGNRKFWGVSLALAALLLILFRGQVELGVQRGAEMSRTLFGSPALTRTCLTQLRLSQQVATQLLAPVDLVSDHQGYYSLRWSDPGVWISVMGVLASIFLCVWLWRKRYRWQAWAVGTIVGTHLQHCPYVLGEYYCEYRIYPSIFCFTLLVAAGLAGLFSRYAQATQRFWMISMLVVCVYCLGTWSRSIAWTSVDRLASDALTTYPLNIRSHYHVIMAANAEGDHQRVIEQRERMNLAMVKIQEFNRTRPYGRMLDWPLAVKYAIVAEGMAARSTAAEQGLDAGLAQLKQLTANLEKQGMLEDEETRIALSAAKMWVYADAGRYDEIPEVIIAPLPEHPTWYQRAVKKVEAAAFEAGYRIDWGPTKASTAAALRDSG